MQIQTLEERRLLTANAVPLAEDSSVRACYAETAITAETQPQMTEDTNALGPQQTKSGAVSGSNKGGGKPIQAGISVSRVNPRGNGPKTTERGGTDQFQVALKSQPKADVMIQMNVPLSTEGEIDVSELSFTPDNWNTLQRVTVTGVDDLVADGNVDYVVVLEPAISDDPDYSGLDPADFGLTNIDDETTMTNVIYARDFVAETRQRGRTEFQFVVDVGFADSGLAAGGVNVVVSVYDSSVTDLNNESTVQNFQGTTDSDGIFSTAWLKLGSGEYHVEVHDLFLAEYYWDPLDDLDFGADEDNDGRPDLVLTVS